MRYVYAFEEGSKEQKYLLGGKGANLAEMTKLGLPVPPGFTITTDACKAYMAAGDRSPTASWTRSPSARSRARGQDGQAARRRRRPAARVGALGRAVLDAGDDGHRPQPRAQRRVGRRSRQADRQRALRVRLVPPVHPDVRQDRARRRRRQVRARARAAAQGARRRDRPGAHRPTTCAGWSTASRRSCSPTPGIEFPQDPAGAAAATRSRRCSARGTASAPASTGAWRRSPTTSAPRSTCRRMVFGNKGDDSGTGVAFTRNPASGENAPYGDFLRNAQGEDVVAGIRVTEPLDAMARHVPGVPHAAARRYMALLERHYRDMCDIEFTIEQGRLFLLQTRVGKRTAAAALRMAVEMEEEGLIDQREAVLRVAARAARPAAAPAVRPDRPSTTAVTKGLNASPGAAVGQGLLHRRRRRGAPRAPASR